MQRNALVEKLGYWVVHMLCDCELGNRFEQLEYSNPILGVGIGNHMLHAIPS